MYDHKSTLQALFDDPVARTNAASYMVDHNMSYTDATKKANKEAIAGTVAIIAIYGALKITDAAMH